MYACDILWFFHCHADGHSIRALLSVLTKGVNPGGMGVIYPPHVLTWGDNMSFIPPPHVLTLKSVVFFCSGKLIMFYNVCF